MKRIFNYTGRRKIERRDISITLREERGNWVFDATTRLSGYHFPQNAEVWFEAHRQNLWMQFPWGTVSAAKPAGDRRLTEFDVPDGVLFRVRVVQPQGQAHHKLLGEADGLRFVKAGAGDDKRRPLLEPVPDELGQLMWKMDFASDPPHLLVNKNAKPNWKDFARSQHFLALVYPEVFRQVLSRILLDDAWTDDDEGSEWNTDWVRFARNLGVADALPDPNDKPAREAWIGTAVSAFANRHQFHEILDQSFEEESR